MNKKYLYIILVLFVCVTTIYSRNNVSVVKADDVIKIYNIDDLKSINNNMNGNYILMNDIDLTESTSSGSGWIPIGSNGKYGDTAFSGTFDGNGYTIKGLRINISKIPKNAGETIYAGLFANNEGNICNLNICDAVININVKEVGVHFGVLAGQNSDKVSNIYVNTNTDINDSISLYQLYYGNYEKRLSNRIGGIIGYNLADGEIALCSVDGTINAIGGGNYYDGKGESLNGNVFKAILYQYIGGVCGSSKGIIEKCYGNTTLNIKGDSKYYHINGWKPSDSVPKTTYSYVGGIAGYTNGDIYNCYNNSNLEYENIALYPQHTIAYYAGISGSSNSNIHITNCYNSGMVVGATGKAITDNESSDVKDCFYLSGSALNQNGSNALYDSLMCDQRYFKDFDFNNTWICDSESDYMYPQLIGNRQDNKNIDSIELVKKPDKLEYYSNDRIDSAGGTIKVIYKDGSSKIIDISYKMLSGYDMSRIGTQSVLVDYRGFVQKFDINILERPQIKNMKLTSEPDTKEFVEGTHFDFSGCKAEIEYENGTIDTIDIYENMTQGGNINDIGEQTITFSLNDKTVSFVVSVVPVSVESIRVVSLPNKIQFVERTDIDLEGLKIDALYNNGIEKEITDYQFGDFPTEIGKHSIIISYEGVETTIDIEIIEKSAVSILVKNNPLKQTYIIGQAFDETGLVVEATYDNGEIHEVKDYTIGELPSVSGMGTITVYYQNKEAYIPVTMIDRVVESISIGSLPKKTTYIEGENFDKTGLVVLATYNDETEEEIYDYSLSNIDNTVIGENTVIVKYGNSTAEFNINVVKKKLIDIQITEPEKKEYINGEAFDKTGLVVKAKYDNNKYEIIEDYVLSGFGAKEEENTITVSYGGINKSFSVIIHNPEKDYTIKQATCCEGGEWTKKCTTCGKILESIKTYPDTSNGHVWDEGRPAKVNNGIGMLYYCKLCNAIKIGIYDPSKEEPSVISTPEPWPITSPVSFESTPTPQPKSTPESYNSLKKVKISKINKYEKALTVKWKKIKNAKGYELQCSTSKKFKSGKKTKKFTIKKAKTISKKVKGLKSNTKYYIRIRYYTVLNGKKVYSDWSKIKSCKTKKTKTNKSSEKKKDTSADSDKTSVADDDMVWIPKSGKKYHKTKTCSHMNNPKQVTKEYAEDHGYTPCSKCY